MNTGHEITTQKSEARIPPVRASGAQVKSCIILGGGVSGLTLADKLSDAGVEVTVIEKRDFWGGLCRRIELDGSKVDLGPHNLRVSDPEILEYWNELLGEDLLKRSFIAKLYFTKSILTYPIKPFEVLSSLPAQTLVGCGANLVKQKVLSYFQDSEAKSFEDWAIQNYGKGLYNAFFGPLTEKVWGVDPSVLDANFAKERLPALSFRRVLFGMKPKGGFHSEDISWNQHYFPKYGVYQIIDTILKKLEKKGVKLLSSTTVENIQEDSDGVTVFHKEGEIRADYLASTIPLSFFSRLCRALKPIDMPAVGYRGTGFLFLSVPASVRMSASWVYCANREDPFNRITDFRHFSDSLSPQDRNIICVEFNTPAKRVEDLGDSVEKILVALKKLKFIDLSTIYSQYVEVEGIVYPVYLKGYKEQVFDFLNQSLESKRTICLGRQGLFSYLNIDKVMKNAFDCSDLILKAPFKTQEKKKFYSIEI